MAYWLLPTSHEFQTIIVQVLERKLSAAQAIALMEEDRDSAVSQISTAIIPISTTREFINMPNDGLENFFAVAWHFLGKERCLSKCQYTFSNVHGWHQFMAGKVLENFDSFNNSELERIKTFSPRLSNWIDDIRSKRLQQRADAKLKIPKEIQSDEVEVKRIVSSYPFPLELNEALNKVDAEIMQEGDGFDQAATLKHLRTFYEKLHEHIGLELRKQKPATADGTNLSSLGQAVEFLQRKGVLTDKMMLLAKSVYGVLSNEGVHAFKSEQEYVRLCRNIVIEYALVLFHEFARRLGEQP